MSEPPIAACNGDRLDIVLGKLDQVRKSGKHWTALCPSHDDQRASLSIRENSDGTIALHCFAGCTVEAILKRLGLEEEDLSDNTIYDYVDEEGTLLYQKVRRPPKRFSFRCPTEDGRYRYDLNGVRRVLYNLPGVIGRPDDFPVFLVEGEKDADRLIDLGWVATTTDAGAGRGKRWDPTYTAALKGADVIILPDNDPAGQEYAQIAASHLYGSAKSIHIIELPDLPAKGDVSDWLDAGGTKKQLHELLQATPEWRPPEGGGTGPGLPGGDQEEFVVLEGAIHHMARVHGGGVVPRRLCNFDARVLEDVSHDDGADCIRKYRIGSPQFPSPIEIEAVAFTSLDWVAKLGGARAIVGSGRETRSKLAEAILTLSQQGLVDRTVFTHLGWRQIGGQWLYLHAGGAIGSVGPMQGIEVEPEGRLRDCRLPAVRDVQAAVRASLGLLKVAPPRVTYPLLAATYRAPLSQFAPVTMSLFLVGDSGTRKSAICGIAQAHFGAAFADGKSFPSNWSSTGNSIERTAFLAKDALCCIDDFVPKGSTYEVQKLNKVADQVLRGQGNQAGRGRMRSDTSLRSEMFSRGLILASGEVTPEGKSLGARMVLVEVLRDDVDNAVLTNLQRDAHAGLLAEAMAAYVQWEAGRTAVLEAELLTRQNKHRAQVHGTHARTPDNTAQLIVGMEEFLAFAVSMDALTRAEASLHLSTALKVLVEQAAAQDRHTRDEDPVNYFLELVRAVLTSAQRGHLQTRDGKAPPLAQACGWRERHFRGAEGAEDSEWHPQGECIGWIEHDNLWLESSSTYAAVERLARDQGRSLGIPKTQLWKRMKERGLLLSTRAPTETKAQTKIMGSVKTTLIHVSAEATLDLVPQRASATNEQEEELPY